MPNNALTQLAEKLRNAKIVTPEEINRLVLERQETMLKEFFAMAAANGYLPQEILQRQGKDGQYFVATVAGEWHESPLWGESVYRKIFFADGNFCWSKPSKTSGPDFLAEAVRLNESIVENILTFCQTHYAESGPQRIKTYPGTFPVKVESRWAAGGYEDERPRESLIVVVEESPEAALSRALSRFGFGRENVFDGVWIYFDGQWHGVTYEESSRPILMEDVWAVFHNRRFRIR